MTLKQCNEGYINLLSSHALCQGRVFVPGEGEEKSPRVMMVGEAPGEQETIEKRPFVGKAGKNLNHFLEIVELRREEIYITNVVKIRPTTPGKNGRTKNRAPSKEEVALFHPWLIEEIRLVSPHIIVTLGNTPLKALFQQEAVIGTVHGKVQDVGAGYKLFPLYHPAAIIYNRSLVAAYEADLSALRFYLKS